MPHLAGIDEAGYGPILGPLTVVCVSADSDDPVALDAALRHYGAEDSKRLYGRRGLACLEAVALAAIRAFGGRTARTAAELFACCTVAGQEPTWAEAADTLPLPLAASDIPDWHLPVRSSALRGLIIHPTAINACYRSGGNRASLEADGVTGLIADLNPDAAGMITVDRLGGRRYYRELLQAAHPGQIVMVIEESTQRSQYRIGRHLEARFLVQADRSDALTATASCVAKYLREISMRLFNQAWCRRLPGLQATAGYPQDAKRWLSDLGWPLVAEHADTLVRGDASRYCRLP